MSSERLFELWIACDPRQADATVPDLFEAGVSGLEERRRGRKKFWVAYAGTKREAKELARKIRERGWEVEEREVEASGWRTEWMRFLEPEAITPRLVLCPTGKSLRAREKRRALWFDPDQVFGVGSHATTKLAARAVERICLTHRPARVLDVGTGTGVLAMVAVVSGAERALGIDSDRRAVQSARNNCRLNRLAPRARFSDRPLAGIDAVFDLVVANLEARVLERLAPDLVRVTNFPGRLLVTGLLEAHRPGLERLFRAAGMRQVGLDREAEWALIELERAGRLGKARQSC